MPRLILWPVLVAVLAAPVLASPAGDVRELESIRQDLRDRLRARAAEDAKVEPPRDVRLDVDPGLARGRMRLILRRQGGRWHLRGIEGGPKGAENVTVDASGLEWVENRLAGPVVVAWGGEEEPDEEPAEGEEAETEALPAAAAAQTFRIEARVAPAEERLVLALERFQGRHDWVLAYRRDADAWVFDRELETPRHLTSGGPFRRQFSRLEPDAEGRFDGRIHLTYTGDQERHVEAYTGHPPRVTFSGRLVDGRVDRTWLLEAPGGKGLLGSGQDRLSGALRTAQIEGRARSEGAKGVWIAAVRGAVMPAPADPVASLVAADAGTPPSDPAAATVRAAEVYDEILALDMTLREYPMPLTDALSRVLVPAPEWPKDAPVDAMGDYTAALLAQAKKTLEPGEGDVPLGRVGPDDPTFGPFYGLASEEPLPDRNRVPKVGDGPQAWRAVAEWRMVGPFGVHDQEADVRYPELADVPAAFRRARVFTSREGEAETVEDAAPWIEPVFDGATVAAPQTREASAGSLRYLAWYAATEITSDAAQTAWMAMTLQGQGMVWLNETLVYKSGPDFDARVPAVFQVRLAKGRNRLLVRCASNRASNSRGGAVDYLNGHSPRPAGRIDFTTFALHVATQGAPGDNAGDSSAVAPPADAPRRYRRDGSGVYPEATPPPAWDLERGINVVWRTPLPEGLAEPVVRDGRLYVTAEPNVLFALDASSGEIVWQREIEAPPLPKGAKLGRGRTATVSPVVTADRVYVTFGTGVAACFTTEGEPVWTTPTGAPWAGTNLGSPILAGGKLVVQGHRPGGDEGKYAVLALDARAGTILWAATGPAKRTTTKYDRPAGLGNGLALVRLARGQATRTLVVTGDGAVLDLADGAMLHRDIFTIEATRGAPYVDGDVVYAAPVMGEEAVRLWLDARGRVGARTLWVNPPMFGLGQVRTVRAWGEHHWMAEPVVVDGLLYVVRVDKAHVPGHHNLAWTQLETFDAGTGDRLTRKRAVLRDASDPTVPPAVAGEYLYVADGGDPVGGFGGTTTHGRMAVLELLPEPADGWSRLRMHTPTHSGAWGLAALVSRNTIGRTRAAPVFEGDRMFLRAYDAVTCVGVTDARGKQYALEQWAATTVKELIGQRPKPPKAIEPAGSDAPPASDRVPVVRAAAGGRADDWLVLGPLPREGAEENVLASLGGPAEARPEAGTKVALGDRTLTFRRVQPEHFVEPGKLDLAAALEGNRDCAAYLYTMLEVGRRQDVRYVPSAPVVATWIGGRPVVRDDIVHLDVGYVPMLLRVRLERVPAFVQPKLELGFQRPRLTFDTPELWAARVERLRERLEDICRTLPGTTYARSARVSLEGAGLAAPEKAGTPAPAATPGASPEPAPTRSASGRRKESGGSPAWILVGAGGVVAAGIVFILLRQRRPT